MKFANRVRKNYQKYVKQERLNLTGIYNKDFTIQQKLENEMTFVEYLETYYTNIFNSFAISNVDLQDQELGRTQRMEPNAFVYAFVQSDLSTLENKEIYQLTHIDDSEEESGGTEEFIEEFVDQHLYKRWLNLKTYTTAIDYGAMTITDSKNYIYQKNENNLYSDFPDLFYIYCLSCYNYFIVNSYKIY